MFHRSKFFVRFVASILLAGTACGLEESSLDHETSVSETQAAPPVQVSGNWVWREQVHMSLRFGNRVTQFDCFDYGPMSLVQNGFEFTGTSAQVEGSYCQERNGPLLFSNAFGPYPVLDGEIRGTTIHFGFSSPNCPYRGVVSAMAANGTQTIRGTGNCNAPSMPFTATWEACRGICTDYPPICGDGACNGTETCGTCSADCPCVTPVCGNGVCESDLDVYAPVEYCDACPGDCGICPACAHDECTTGVVLVPDCSPCVRSVCAVDPFCCAVEWDSFCVDLAVAICGLTCP